MFVEPPWTGLATPQTLSTIRIEEEGDGGFAEFDADFLAELAESFRPATGDKTDLFFDDSHVYDPSLGGADLTDAFYQFAYEETASYYAIDIEITAYEYGITSVRTDERSDYEGDGEGATVTALPGASSPRGAGPGKGWPAGHHADATPDRRARLEFFNLLPS